MKQTINGKTYNTGTAKEIASRDNGLSVNDFDYVCETLYETPKHKLFLYCEGGARTKYARRVALGNYVGGSKIIPMTWRDADKWHRGETNE